MNGMKGNCKTCNHLLCLQRGRDLEGCGKYHATEYTDETVRLADEYRDAARQRSQLVARVKDLDERFKLQDCAARLACIMEEVGRFNETGKTPVE